MKRLLIIACVIAFAITETSAVGLNSKVMAMKTSATRLSALCRSELPIGLNADTYLVSETLEDDEDNAQNIQHVAILLALSFPVWNKYVLPNDYGNKISSLVPLLLIAQFPMIMLATNSNSIFMKNLMVGIWFGYYMNGWKDSDGSFAYKNTLTITMLGILGTLYLNELLKIQTHRFLFYGTLKMGPVFEKNTWEGDGQKDKESDTKFGIFPALGTEYIMSRILTVFAAAGYNPYGVIEAGMRFNLR